MLRKISNCTVYEEENVHNAHVRRMGPRTEYGEAEVWNYGSGQPHSVAIHLPMLTFFASEVIMNGCCSSCHGYGRSLPERIRLDISYKTSCISLAHQVAMNDWMGSDHVLPIAGLSTMMGTGAVTI